MDHCPHTTLDYSLFWLFSALKSDCSFFSHSSKPLSSCVVKIMHDPDNHFNILGIIVMIHPYKFRHLLCPTNGHLGRRILVVLFQPTSGCAMCKLRTSLNLSRTDGS